MVIYPRIFSLIIVKTMTGKLSKCYSSIHTLLDV